MPLFFKKKENEAGGTVAVGLGGGGCNIVNRLGRLSSVDIVTVNTDRKGLIRSRADKRILLGGGRAEGGCNGDIAMGGSLAAGASEEIQENICGYLNTVIFVGLGGGTGTGSLIKIAEIAKRCGSRTIVFASLPMSFEAGRRKAAADALDSLKDICDISVIFDGDRLAALDPMLGAREAFSVLDQMMCESFIGLTEILDGNDGDTIFRSLKGKMLTVSFAEGMHAEKVAEILVSGPMMDAAAISAPVIFIRGNIPPDGSRNIIADIVNKRMEVSPVFVQGPEGRGMDLMMFIPVG